MTQTPAFYKVLKKYTKATRSRLQWLRLPQLNLTDDQDSALHTVFVEYSGRVPLAVQDDALAERLGMNVSAPCNGLLGRNERLRRR